MQSASVEGLKQAAEILNRLPGNKQQMVELLRAHDPAVVSELEVSMYDFFILSRQTEDTLVRIIEAIAPEQWAIALKGAEPLIRDAILRELERGGQVFFLHNRVTTIEAMRSRLQLLVPHARVVVGHGQMSGDELEAVMTKFVNGEADVLVGALRHPEPVDVVQEHLFDDPLAIGAEDETEEFRLGAIQGHRDVDEDRT